MSKICIVGNSVAAPRTPEEALSRAGDSFSRNS